MRVGVLHNLRAGGAHRRLREQLGHLDADVVEVCLSTASPIRPDAIVVPYRPLAPGVRRAVRPPLRYFDLTRIVRAWRRAAERLDRTRPDVVLANPCRFLQAPAGLLWLSGPTLYFCDEPREPVNELTESRNPRSSSVYARLYARESTLDRNAVSRACALATNSRFTAAAIKRIYGREAVVLPMGVPEGFTPAAASSPAQHVLSVGTLIPDKGHELAIRAAAAARARRPVVVVAPRPGPEESERLRGIAAECGVELDVRIGIADHELVTAYRRAHATLYLAREEPFGLASVEAQACGSPVIVSAAGGLPETLVDGETGWAVPRDPAAVAAKLDRLDDPEVRRPMARAAASHGARAGWKQAGEALEKRLAALAAGGAGSTS